MLTCKNVSIAGLIPDFLFKGVLALLSHESKTRPPAQRNREVRHTVCLFKPNFLVLELVMRTFKEGRARGWGGLCIARSCNISNL